MQRAIKIYLKRILCLEWEIKDRVRVPVRFATFSYVQILLANNELKRHWLSNHVKSNPTTAHRWRREGLQGRVMTHSTPWIWRRTKDFHKLRISRCLLPNPSMYLSLLCYGLCKFNVGKSNSVNLLIWNIVVKIIKMEITNK